MPWVTKLDVDHTVLFLLFQLVEGQASTTIVLVAYPLEDQDIFGQRGVDV